MTDKMSNIESGQSLSSNTHGSSESRLQQAFELAPVGPSLADESQIDPNSNILNATTAKKGFLGLFGGRERSVSQSTTAMPAPKEIGGTESEEQEKNEIEDPERRRFLKFAAGGTIAAGLAAVGVRLAINGGDGEPGVSPVATLTPEIQSSNTPNPTATHTPEATPTPEIKSTPHNIVNEKKYLDGKLTLGIVDGLQTRTKGPKSIMPGIYEGEEVDAVASSGFEINPEWENAAKDVVDLINFGLLYAWSLQTDIPDSQKDLVTKIDESREVQMNKWDKLQERAANGEEFNVTLKVYKDDGFTNEDVTIDIGDDYAYKIDELEKPPIQIKWQSNMGSGIRISPENKEFRIEFYDQYAGGYGSWAEKTLLSSIIVQTIGYLPELVVDQGKIMRPDVFKPDFNYQVNVVRDNLLTLARKYNIIPDAHSGTYSKDWSDSAIHPLP